MEISHRIENDVCVIEIDGNIALDGVKATKNYIRPFLSNEALHAILINFEKVDIIDSTGIGFVVSVFQFLRERNAFLILYNVNKKNQETFSMTRLDKFLNITGTEGDAYKKLKELKESSASSPA
ncbi:MAG: STAS domain-containing protein [SAR324 cluster bacterium]|nr:STAS domain-containing protein [SAR324 cluster bacterium]